MEGTKHMEQELKLALEGMAKHLFGDVQVCGQLVRAFRGCYLGTLTRGVPLAFKASLHL